MQEGNINAGLAGLVFHRPAVAFFAISARRSGVMFSARFFPPLYAERFGSRVFAIANDVVIFITSGDTHDLYSIADHVGGALLSFRSGWHSHLSSTREFSPAPLQQNDTGKDRSVLALREYSIALY